MNVRADPPAAEGVLTLQPGQWWFGGRRGNVHRVATLLGSCVAVTLWHPRLRCGGMCHFVLPRRKAHAARLNARYGDEALELMEHSARRQGAKLADYQAGLFGAANMFPDNPKVTLDVGAVNAEQARALLAARGMVAIWEELLGSEYRYLSLDLANGRIWLRAGNAAGRVLEGRK
jgi:chemotaxis protein CheD